MAREYWVKAPQYLADGDLKQAREKGWEHYGHVAIREAVQALAAEQSDQSERIRRDLNAAESLHGNFYEGHLTAEHTEFNLSELVPLLDIAWREIPEEYTGGVSFADWIADRE